VSVTDWMPSTLCVYCGEKISQDDDNAGVFEMRNEEPLHLRCAELYDKEEA
jgi:hypothetical protein